MIDRVVLKARLQRLVRAAPRAFRADPLFRYAAVGAALALLLLLSRLGEPRASALMPPPPPPPTALDRASDQRGGWRLAAPSVGPIAPGSAVTSAAVRPDGQSQPDRFGTVSSAQPKRPSE